MNTIDATAVRNAITSTKGRFFSITFRKGNGEMRKMTARSGVKKHIGGLFTKSGAGATKNQDNLITVWDSVARDYRSIRLDRVQSFKCGQVAL